QGESALEERRGPVELDPLVDPEEVPGDPDLGEERWREVPLIAEIVDREDGRAQVPVQPRIDRDEPRRPIVEVDDVRAPRRGPLRDGATEERESATRRGPVEAFRAVRVPYVEKVRLIHEERRRPPLRSMFQVADGEVAAGPADSA